ncbi:MAG: preprotein translocase subunit YajC [Alpinimonas sp.]|jgi:preprotein translocase subunit YajC
MDFMTIAMMAVLAVLVFFMFRNGKKRQRDLAELQLKVVAGAHVLTNFGVYGTIISIDEEENKILLETDVQSGATLTIHRQAVSRVVDTTDSLDISGAEALEADAAALALTPDVESGNLSLDPEFGERSSESEGKKKKS